MRYWIVSGSHKLETGSTTPRGPDFRISMNTLEAKKCTACGNVFDKALSFCPNDGLRLVAVDTLIGQTLDGRYRIEKVLGKGGMGVVYCATHVHIDSQFAVKVLNPDLVANQSAIERFRREAKAAGRIQHPNAIQVTDFGVTPERVVYLVMEIAHGDSLRQLLNEAGAFDYRRAVEIMLQVCAAIEAAHQSGVIHRDLKPDNIVIWRVGASERVKVLDFGIAKLRERRRATDTDAPFELAPHEQGTLTEAGTLIGTPHYMSPEQCRAKELGPPSDIYSLGLILYEMLSGELPFNDENPIEVVFKQLKEAPRPLREISPTVPAPIERVVMRALEKDPARRQGSAADFARELQEAVREAAHTRDEAPDVWRSEEARRPAAPAVETPRQERIETPLLPGGRKTVVQAKKSPSPPPDASPRTMVPEPPTPAPFPADTAPAPAPDVTPGGRPARSRRPLIAAAAVILALVIGWFFYPEKAPPPPPPPPPFMAAPEGMVAVPGGKFMMGREGGEPDERPVHEVEVGGFLLDKYEVTNRDYKKFIEASGRRAPLHWEGGSYPPAEASLPVTGVTWQDAADYARWAGKRLPTEEEWEYAARGGAQGLIYPWGNEWKPGFANVDHISQPKPAPVGSFDNDRSAFGVYDLAGNVSEWVQDYFRQYHGAADLSFKVFRGGNVLDEADKAIATYRWYDRMTDPAPATLKKTGFRCAQDFKP